MKIFIKTLKGTHFEIEAEPKDTIADVKVHIEKSQGKDVYPSAQQMLIHQGKVLKDVTTLEENSVTENSFLVIMLSKAKSLSSEVSTTSAAPISKAPATGSSPPIVSPSPVTLTVPRALVGTGAPCQMNSVPICLMYGKEDPWVKPVWGLKVKQQVPEAPYYEISPAGHCPHDEVPEVVNYLLRGWIMNLESQGSVALPLLDSPESVQHDILSDVEFVKEGSRKSVRVRFFGSNFSVWNQIRSYFKSRIANLGINSS